MIEYFKWFYRNLKDILCISNSNYCCKKENKL